MKELLALAAALLVALAGMTGARAADLLECTDKDFLAALQQRFGQRQGRFIRVGERGSYDLNLSVNGATAVDVSTSNFYLYQSVTQIDSAGAQRGAFVPNTGTGEGGFYPVTYDAGVQSKVYLAPIVATLGDTDGGKQ